MSRSGYLFNAEQIRDTNPHLGSSGTVIGAGSGEGGNSGGLITPLGMLRDSSVSFVNVGTEAIVHFDTTNNLDQTVTVVYEGFTGVGSESEIQTLDFGNITTFTNNGALLDISAQGDPEFISQNLPLRGGTQDEGVALSSTDEPYQVPGTPTFVLSYQGTRTSIISYSSDMSAAIQAALEGLVQIGVGDVTVAKTSLSVYTVTFGGNLGIEDVSPLSIIVQFGDWTPTGVTETRKGGTLVDLTDPANWTAIGSPVVITAGNTNTTTVDPNTYLKIRATVTASGAPSSGDLTLAWTSSRGASVFAGI